MKFHKVNDVLWVQFSDVSGAACWLFAAGMPSGARLEIFGLYAILIEPFR